MSLFFQIVLLTVIWVLGLVIVTRQDMLLESVGRWAEKREHKIWKPIITCAWCMPSIHSVFGFLFAYGLGLFNKWDGTLLVMYPLVVMASSFIVGFLMTVLMMFEQAGLYFKNGEQHYHFLNKSSVEEYKKKKHGKTKSYSRTGVAANVSQPNGRNTHY